MSKNIINTTNTINTINIETYPESINLAELKTNNKPIFINFGITTCHACKETQDSFGEINPKFKEKIVYQFAEMNKYKNISEDYQIKVSPTQVVYNSDGSPYISSENAKVKFTPFYESDSGRLLYSYHEGPLTTANIISIIDDMGV